MASNRNGIFRGGVILTLLLVSACTPEQAKQLEYGQAVPGFRLRVELPAPKQVVDVIDELELVVERARFVPFSNPHEKYGRIGVPEDRWLPILFKSVQREKEHRLSFPMRPKDSPVISVIDVYVMTFGEHLVSDDWQLYSELRYDIIPSAFPNSNVRVVTHLSAYTDPEEVDALVELYEQR